MQSSVTSPGRTTKAALSGSVLTERKRMESKQKMKASDTMEEDAEGATPLTITVTSEAIEVLTWRTLARQTVPMLQRPEQFHVSQRTRLAQTICLLLDGELELEDVFGDTEDASETDCCIETGKETW